MRSAAPRHCGARLSSAGAPDTWWPHTSAHRVQMGANDRAPLDSAQQQNAQPAHGRPTAVVRGLQRGNGLVESCDQALSRRGIMNGLPDVLLQYAVPGWLQVGVQVQLCGLIRCQHLNDCKVRVTSVNAVTGTVQVQEETSGLVWNVCWACTRQPTLSFQSVFRSHSWALHSPTCLPPDAFGVATKTAARDFLFEQGQLMWPGEDAKRGVDVEASFFPLVRPRVNPALRAKDAGKVAASYKALYLEPVPRQCQPPTTSVIPLEERRQWPPDKPYPMPQDMCREAAIDPTTGEMEPGTPYERLRAWCDSYFAEWKLVLRGKQKGKRTYRFKYENLSEGDRDGLIIRNYYKEEYTGYQWDHTRHWADPSQPCTPLADEEAQVYSEWYLDVMAKDAEDMCFKDKAIVHELTKVCHSSQRNPAMQGRVLERLTRGAVRRLASGLSQRQYTTTPSASSLTIRGSGSIQTSSRRRAKRSGPASEYRSCTDRPRTRVCCAADCTRATWRGQ